MRPIDISWDKWQAAVEKMKKASEAAKKHKPGAADALEQAMKDEELAWDAYKKHLYSMRKKA